MAGDKKPAVAPAPPACELKNACSHQVCAVTSVFVILHNSVFGGKLLILGHAKEGVVPHRDRLAHVPWSV
eukprot:761503-Prymnesium_polylepis.1